MENKLSIYQIEHEYIILTEQIIENGGEITPENEQQLAINRDQLEAKGRSYGYVIKSLESDIDTIDAEIKRLSALKQSRNKTIDRLKEVVKNAMEMYDITEIKTPTLKINFRKSESVEVDELIINKKWCNIKQTITPDKTKIKEALKQGEVIEGATINYKNNLQIK